MRGAGESGIISTRPPTAADGLQCRADSDPALSRTPVRRGYHPPMTAARRAFALTLWTVLSLALLGGSARSDRDPADQLRRFTAQVEFDFVGWTLGALGAKLGQDSIGEVGYLPEAERTELVRRYPDLVDPAGRRE